MKWVISLPDRSAESALAWMHDFFDRFDVTQVSSLRVGLGNSRYQGVYGHCTYPTKGRPTFRISCSAPGPFPCETATRKRPLYPRADGSFPRAPRGCRRGQLCYDPNTGRMWYRLRGKTRLASLDEAVVWIVSHEAFHFLRHTRQVPGRNTEIDADSYADEQLNDFRTPAGAPSPAAATPRPGLRQMIFPWLRLD